MSFRILFMAPQINYLQNMFYVSRTMIQKAVVVIVSELDMMDG